MNPTGAPEPPGDLCRIVRGIFVLPAGAHERTRGCSPRAPGRFGQNRLGGFVLSVGAHERTRECSPRAPGQFGQNYLGVFVSGRVRVFFSRDRVV